MIPLEVHGYRMGEGFDGYVTVDTDAWLEDRAEYSEALTETLRECAEEQEKDGRPDYDAAVASWLAERNAAGLYGEGNPMTVATVSEDTFLDDDLVFTYAELPYDPESEGPENGAALIIVRGHGYWPGSAPTVYVLYGMGDAEAFDYARAGFGCANGHLFDSDDTVHLYQDGCYSGGEAPRISDNIRSIVTALDFADDNRAWVIDEDFILSCPVCHAPMTGTVY